MTNFSFVWYQITSWRNSETEGFPNKRRTTLTWKRNPFHTYLKWAECRIYSHLLIAILRKSHLKLERFRKSLSQYPMFQFFYICLPLTQNPAKNLTMFRIPKFNFKISLVLISVLCYPKYIDIWLTPFGPPCGAI